MSSQGTLNPVDVDLALSQVESSRSNRESAQGPRKWLTFVAPRICGLLPWSEDRKRLALAYQVSLAILVVVCLAAGALELQDASSGASFTDTLLGLGSLLSLMVGFWTRHELSYCNTMLADVEVVAAWTWRTHAANLVELVGIWLVAVGVRIRGVLAEDAASLPSALQFVLSSFLLLCMTAYFRSIVKILQSRIQDYCCDTFVQVDLARAEECWDVVQALIRNSCCSIERCFVLTQMIGVVALLAFASDATEMVRSDAALDELLPQVPGALVGLGISKTMLQVASLTDMCERVPSLFCSLPTGGDLTANRIRLVQHIMYSQTGFYTFNVCLNSTVVLKMIYLTCVLAVAIGTRI